MVEEITAAPIDSLEALAQHADYSLLDTLCPDPQATADGTDREPRQVFQGHYVPVKPMPIEDLVYVVHSIAFLSVFWYPYNMTFTLPYAML